jgi:quinol-cytochrome oxidoreductase complex cytochrome b subunit
VPDINSLAARAADWIDERLELGTLLEVLLRKPVPAHARTWFFCLGGVTFFLFLVQGVTGIMLSLYYKPTSREAYESILFIMNNVRFGWLIRSIHSWSASAMILFCFLHMLRVYIMAAYKSPRELNWVAGMGLLGLTMVFGFTGYLLPWDQKALWGTTIGSEIMGAVPLVGPFLLQLLRAGTEVAGLTLTRFYGLHVLVMPLLTVIFLGAHFVMIRKQGISEPL